MVKQQQLNLQNSKVQIEAEELKPGVYYYEVKQGNTNINAEKIIIVK